SLEHRRPEECGSARWKRQSRDGEGKRSDRSDCAGNSARPNYFVNGLPAGADAAATADPWRSLSACTKAGEARSILMTSLRPPGSRGRMMQITAESPPRRLISSSTAWSCGDSGVLAFGVSTAADWVTLWDGEETAGAVAAADG